MGGFLLLALFKNDIGKLQKNLCAGKGRSDHKSALSNVNYYISKTQQSAGRLVKPSGALHCRFWPNFPAHWYDARAPPWKSEPEL